MFGFEEAALAALRADPEASIAEGVDLALRSLADDALRAPLLATARLRAFVEQQGYASASASLVPVIGHHRRRLLQVATSERTARSWQAFAGGGGSSAPVVAAVAAARRSNGPTQPFHYQDGAVVLSRRGRSA